MKRIVILSALVALASTSAMATTQGGIFVTGHDPDYHAVRGGNTAGAQKIIQTGINYVTNNSPTTILLVTDTVSPGGDNSDSRLGLTAAGYTYDGADNGSAGGSVLNLNTVNFSNYSAVVIASDYGGWLKNTELSILNARSADIISYINNGGGLVAFAESSSNQPTTGQFGYLPFLVTSQQFNQSEVGIQVTAFGQSLGLTNGDINGNASHNVFVNDAGMNVVDRDSQGQILTLAYRGQITPTGVSPTPEPTSFVLAGLGLLGVLRRKSSR